MRTHRPREAGSPASGALRGFRAGVLAVLCVLLPLAGHGLGQGHAPQWIVVAGVAAVAVPGAAVLTRHRLTDSQVLGARTAEAAARQGRFEDMNSKLFTAQRDWGEATDSPQGVFRGYAEQLRPDMKKFDAHLADPAVADRVRSDQRDGLGPGVQGTPTFLVDGETVASPGSYEAFKALIEARLSD